MKPLSVIIAALQCHLTKGNQCASVSQSETNLFHGYATMVYNVHNVVALDILFMLVSHVAQPI